MKHPAVMKHLIVDICCLSMIFGVTSSAYAADIAGIDSVKPSDSASSATASPAEQASEEESPSDKRAGETEPKAANTPITSSGATSADTAEKKTDAKTGSKPNGSSEPADPLTGWKTVGGERHWFDDGVEAKSKEIYDPGSGAWYWIDADGTMAHDKDVFLSSNGGKWVRYDHDGRMVKGEDFRYGGWYLFDGVTGEMAKGVAHVDSNGGKWVYYDTVTGQMAHGERYLDYDAAHTGWYLFDQTTGAMVKGECYRSGKWYYYDPITGKMAHGVAHVDSNGGKWAYYDINTGVMQYGEIYLNYDRDHTGWYYFDPHTGAMDYDWAWIPNNGKWVYYDHYTGQMQHGTITVDGRRFTLDNVTGAAQGKAVFQNRSQYFQVSSANVTVPGGTCGSSAKGRFDCGYASPSRLDIAASREDAIETFIRRAFDYMGTPYKWDYAAQPGMGVDCAGLVMQSLYASGMSLGDYNPYKHWYDAWHSHDANNMAADGRFPHVDLADRQRGDLIFWAGHVAIYLGNDQIIEANVPRVRTASLWEYGNNITAVARPFA